MDVGIRKLAIIFKRSKMMKKGKKEQKYCCGEHTFVLKPVGSKCYYREAISSNFCLNYYRNRKSRAKNSESCYEGPVFNQDKNYQTHCFILNSEKVHLERVQKKYLKAAYVSMIQEDVQMQNHDEKSYLIPPKPNKRNTYCNVCKERYNDYMQHIREPSHLANIRKTRANQAIKELQRKYQGMERCQSREKQPTQTVSQFSNLIVIDEDDSSRPEPIKIVGNEEEPIKLEQQGGSEMPAYARGPFQYDIPCPPNPMFEPLLGNLMNSAYQMSNLPFLQASPSFLNLNLNINYNFHLMNPRMFSIGVSGSQGMTPNFCPLNSPKQIVISSDKS